MRDTPTAPPQRLAWLGLGLALGALAVQAPLLNRMVVPMDEGHLTAAVSWMHAGKHLYSEIHTGLFPGVYLLTYGLFGIFGENLLVTRIAAALVNVATALFLWRITARATDERWGWLAPHFAYPGGSMPAWFRQNGTLRGKNPTMRTWIAVLIGASVGLGLGFGLGLRLGVGVQGEPSPGSGSLQELARARAENDDLRSRLEARGVRPESGPGEGIIGLAGDPGFEEPVVESADEKADASRAEADPEADLADTDPAGGGSAFDVSRLLALGFHPADIERLRRVWESLELEKLYIRDERARSDKHNGRFFLRLVSLERDTLAELGEEEYDALLYASGARNRVRVRNVLPESAADVAGLAAGDEVTSYDGEPIFRMMTLKQGTIRCEQGTTVALGVTRSSSGREERVWVPCGPLGIELEMVNAEPR